MFVSEKIIYSRVAHLRELTLIIKTKFFNANSFLI
jgi:hypothetical protein